MEALHSTISVHRDPLGIVLLRRIAVPHRFSGSWSRKADGFVVASSSGVLKEPFKGSTADLYSILYSTLFRYL